MPCYSASKSLSLKPQSISQISHCFITSWAVLFSVAEYSLCPYHIFDGFEENQSRQIQLSQQPKAEKNVKTEDLCQILSKTGFFFFSIGYKLIKTTVKNYSAFYKSCSLLFLIYIRTSNCLCMCGRQFTKHSSKNDKVANI